MSARNSRSRLGLEQLEDRCTPGAIVGGQSTHYPALHGGSLVAVSYLRATREHVVPIKLAFQCSADMSTGNATASGFATHLGHWTSQGRVDRVDLAAGWATIRGTTTILTANGDKLFVKFLSSWELSSGKGHEWIRVTGGTGRFAGATGGAILDCTITADPASPTTFRCNCTGSGTLILARR
jgi:hypothetical protein